MNCKSHFGLCSKSLTTFLSLGATRSIILPPPPPPFQRKMGCLSIVGLPQLFVTASTHLYTGCLTPRCLYNCLVELPCVSCRGIVAIKKRFTSFPLTPPFSILSTKCVDALDKAELGETESTGSNVSCLRRQRDHVETNLASNHRPSDFQPKV